MLIAGFAAALIADLKLLEKGYWPAWMRTLTLTSKPSRYDKFACLIDLAR
jgi:hypothetical protein